MTATTTAEECGAIPPNVRSPVPCHLPPGHDGEHFSTTGCAGSEIRWADAPTTAERLAAALCECGHGWAVHFHDGCSALWEHGRVGCLCQRAGREVQAAAVDVMLAEARAEGEVVGWAEAIRRLDLDRLMFEAQERGRAEGEAAVRAELEPPIDRVRRLHSQHSAIGLAPGKWCPGCGEEEPSSPARPARHHVTLAIHGSTQRANTGCPCAPCARQRTTNAERRARLHAATTSAWPTPSPHLARAVIGSPTTLRRLMTEGWGQREASLAVYVPLEGRKGASEGLTGLDGPGGPPDTRKALSA